jgi:hypothetical protein
MTPDLLRQQPAGQQTAAVRLGFAPPPEPPPPALAEPPPRPGTIPAGPRSALPEPDFLRAALRRFRRYWSR